MLQLDTAHAIVYDFCNHRAVFSDSCFEPQNWNSKGGLLNAEKNDSIVLLSAIRNEYALAEGYG